MYVISISIFWYHLPNKFFGYWYMSWTSREVNQRGRAQTHRRFRWQSRTNKPRVMYLLHMSCGTNKELSVDEEAEKKVKHERFLVRRISTNCTKWSLMFPFHFSSFCLFYEKLVQISRTSCKLSYLKQFWCKDGLWYGYSYSFGPIILDVSSFISKAWSNRLLVLVRLKTLLPLRLVRIQVLVVLSLLLLTVLLVHLLTLQILLSPPLLLMPAVTAKTKQEEVTQCKRVMPCFPSRPIY